MSSSRRCLHRSFKSTSQGSIRLDRIAPLVENRPVELIFTALPTTRMPKERFESHGPFRAWPLFTLSWFTQLPHSTLPALLLASLLFPTAGLLRAETTKRAAQVFISEILANNSSLEKDNYHQYSDWLELHNPSPQPINLWDWGLSDDSQELHKWYLPNLTLRSGESLRIWCSGRNDRNPKAPLHTNFKLSAKGETLYLTKPEDDRPSYIFDYTNRPQFPNVSFGISKEAFGQNVFGDGLKGRFYLPTEAPIPRNWYSPTFNDYEWSQGKAPFGLDRQAIPTNAAEIRTDLSMLVPQKATKAFFRFPFQFNKHGNRSGRLQLNVRYKDGLVCYLNGERIARTGVLKGTHWDPRAKRFIAKNELGSMQSLEIDNITEKLIDGINLLAFEVSFGEGSPIDFHLSPNLSYVSEKAPTKTNGMYLLAPSPGKSNGTGFAQVAPRPSHSMDGGFFANDIILNLTLPQDANGSIHYTTDGTIPTRDSTVYTGPLILTSSVEVKSRTYQPNAHPSPVTTESYSILDSNSLKFHSNLPIILIDTHGKEIGLSDYTSAGIQIFENGTDHRTRLTGTPSYSGRAGIKLRGSSTLVRPKKGYRIELLSKSGDEAPSRLLGMPSDGDWILYGPYNHNKTLINNALVYEMSRRMGRYAPRTRFVEAFVNDDAEPMSMTAYVGLYILMEKIERSANRVAVHKPGLGGASLSGGYIFKIDRRGPGELGFRAGMQDLVNVDPNETKISTSQSQWLRQYLNQFFDVLAGPNFADPKNGYAAYIDVDSWIDHRFLQEITRNPDAYSLSTYFTKPRGSKLQAGPVWDFDRAFYFGADLMERGYYERWMTWSEELGYNWDKLLMDDPQFRKRFRARGLALMDSVWSTSNVHALIDNIASEIEEAQERNYRRWGHLTPEEWRTWIGYQKRYIARRLSWLRGECLEPPEYVTQESEHGSKCIVSLHTSHANASIYYTKSAREPYKDNGDLDKQAKRYIEPIQLKENETLTAAIKLDEVWSNPSQYHCNTAPIPLAITEIMYHPEKVPELEFIEFQNIGTVPIELKELEITEGVDFDFSESQIDTIDPGEVIVIVRDLQAFKTAYDVAGINIAGEYEDSLSDTSERIHVSNSNGKTVLDIFYSDTWYPETDQRGHSLMLKTPSSTNAHRWRDPRNWRPSPSAGGSPGVLEATVPYWY